MKGESSSMDCATVFCGSEANINQYQTVHMVRKIGHGVIPFAGREFFF